MKDNEYKLYRFHDLLSLDDDQVKRFAEELPGIISDARKIIKTLEVAGYCIGLKDDPRKDALHPIVWIDDGERNLDLSVMSGHEELFTIRLEGEK